MVDVASFQLLRRHIGQAATEVSRRRRAFQFRAETDVEIGQLRAAVGGQQHIGRLHVAMQHATEISVIERFGQACSEPADDFRPALRGQAAT